MQETRHEQIPPGKRDIIKVPSEYWDELQQRNPDELCKNSMALPLFPQGVRIRFLQDDLLVDIQNQRIRGIDGRRRHDKDQPLLELIVLVYLLNVTPAPLSRDMISVNDLKDAHFFQGPHTLKTAPVLKRFGRDLAGFKQAAEKLGGQAMDLADAAYKLTALPKIPLYYLLWEGDEEFAPHLSVLFDRSIEQHLSADAIWGLVTLVSNALLASV